MWIILLLLLRWRYSPGWALASFTIRLQASGSLALYLHSFIPIFLRSVDTSSSHLIFGLPLRLVAYSFPYIFFFWNCGVLHSFYVTKPSYSLAFNLLTPNVNYSGRTAPLTSKVSFYIFIQQVLVLNILNMVYTLRFFLFKMQFVS